uniref:PID domain-containing protein n=1 Tax=Panagrellus redivivus TaxID=6233 RepID=A0A7E4ZYW3_PANRE
MAAADDDWLQDAIVQLKTGIPFFVKFLGKITLPKSINEAPTDEERAEVVLGCLRKVALSAGHVDSAHITPFAAEFLSDATVVARNTDVQLTIYSNAFILADVITRRIVARHNTTEIAFAHVDPDFDDVIGYYCVDHKKGKPDTRCYYVIASDSAAQILASIKLAFVVLGEQTASGGIVNTQNIADLLTPSPSVPSTPSGAYCLLRLSTPSDDGKGFVHTEKPVSTDTVQRTLRRMTPTSPGADLQSILNTPSTPGSVTNVYLNVNVLQGVNPYTTNTIYPDVFTKYCRPRRPSPKFKETNPRRLSTVEEVQNQPALEAPAAAAPPLPPKKEVYKGEPLKVNRSISFQEPVETLVTPEMDGSASSPASYVTYSRRIVDPPQLPQPAEIRDQVAKLSETRSELYPEVKVEHDETNVELERLHKELQRVKEQIRKRNAAMETRPPEASPQTPIRAKPKGPKRVMFQKLRKSFTDVGVPLKSKLGSLRTGAIKPRPAPPADLQSPGSASECTSLNSSIFDGISLDSSSTRSASSADSGCQGDNELFVFPEAAHEAAHWTKRILKIEDPLPITPTQFAQISEYLSFQPWFHGTVRRELAEARLVKDGEFLVRQSASQPGQFIVTALRRRTVHHIRVVSRDGQIRSHAGDFGSIVQLIQYHFTTKTPLCSKTTAIMLMTPVPRPAFWKHPKT